MPRFRANSSGMSYHRYDGVSRSQISRAMSSSVPPGWRNRYNGRFDGSMSEQSQRSSSLTSIVDMYRPPSCTPSVQSCPLRSQTYGTFYYDYSEDFDSHPQPIGPPAPLAPIPTRLPSFRRATVLNDGYDTRLQVSGEHDVAFPLHFPSSKGRDQLDSTDQEENGKVSYPSYSLGFQGIEHIESDISTNANVDCLLPVGDTTGKPVLPMYLPIIETEKLMVTQNAASNGEYMVSSDDQEKNCSIPVGDELERECAMATQISRGQRQSVEVDSGRLPLPRNPAPPEPKTYTNESRNLPVFTNTKRTTPCHSHTVPESHTSSNSSTPTSSKRGTKVYSFEPGLSDLASLVQHLDKVAEFVDDDESSIFSRVDLPIGVWRAASLHNVLGRDETDRFQDIKHGNLELDGGEEADTNGFTTDFRGHKRNLAVPKIYAGHLSLSAELNSTDAADRPRADDNSQPRQPTTRLRLQSSAPQLMKALPPLPNGSVRSESYVANLSADDVDLPMRFSPFELSRITTPRSMLSAVSSLDIPRSRQNGDFGTLISSKDGGRMGDLRHHPHSTLAKAISTGVDSSSRLGMRSAGREACSLVAPTFGEGRKSPKSSNGRLRLRVSRSAMSKAHGDLKHYPSHISLRPTVLGLEDSSQPLELPPQERYCLPGEVRNKINPGRYERDPASCQTESGSISGPTPGTSLVMLSSQIEEQYLDKAPKDSRTPALRATSTSSNDPCNSFFDRGSASGKTGQGLRKRISDLRIRVTEARLRSAEPTSPGHQTHEGGLNLITLPHAAHSDSAGCDAAIGPDEGAAGRESPSLPSRGFRRRVFRWMRVARHAVMVACAGSRKRG